MYVLNMNLLYIREQRFSLPTKDSKSGKFGLSFLVIKRLLELFPGLKFKRYVQ